MNTIAPKRIILFGGSRDGLTMDAPIDAKVVIVPAFEPAYAHAQGQRDASWLELASMDLRYQDSGHTNAAGLPIFVLAA